MATKKPTITLGKGTTATPASRPVSAKPSQASQVRAAQRTTSSGITTRPDGRRQSEGRSGRQATSRATVSTADTRNPYRVRAGINQNNKPGAGRVTGTMGRPKPATPAKVTGVTPPPQSPKPKPTAGTTNTIRATGGNSSYDKLNRLSAASAPRPQQKPTAAANLAQSQQLLRSQLGPFISGLRGLGIQAIAETVAPRPASARAGLKEGQAAANAAIKAKGKTADSFGGQYQKPAAGAKPKPAPKISKAQSFDNAFASARNSGMSSFVWGGKRYTTKLK